MRRHTGDLPHRQTDVLDPLEVIERRAGEDQVERVVPERQRTDVGDGRVEIGDAPAGFRHHHRGDVDARNVESTGRDAAHDPPAGDLVEQVGLEGRGEARPVAGRRPVDPTIEQSDLEPIGELPPQSIGMPRRPVPGHVVPICVAARIRRPPGEYGRLRPGGG